MSGVATQGQALDRPPGSGSEPCWIPSAHSLTEATSGVALFANSQCTSVLRVSLPKRLGRYGLTLHADKTRVLPFGRPPRRQQGGTQDAECRPAPAADNQDATKAHLRRSYDGLNLGFVLTLDKRSPDTPRAGRRRWCPP